MAHPLLDRRDATAARSGNSGAVDLTPIAALAAEQAATNHALERMLREFNAQSLELCITDREPAQFLMRNFPVPGAQRLIVRRQGTGGQFTLTAGTPLEILQANENRLGGSIVVSGTGNVTLFLTQDLLTPGGGTPLTQGSPQIFLAASGGAWDLRLGNALWCGSVTALSTAGSTIVVAEV